MLSSLGWFLQVLGLVIVGSALIFGMTYDQIRLELAVAAGVQTGVRGALQVDRRMRTNLPDVLAAVDAYKKYLGSHEDDAEAHYNLGQTYANLGNYSEAIRQYRVATKLKTDDPDIYYDLGVAHTKLAQYDQAVAAFSKSLEIDPDYHRAQDGLDEAREGEIGV